MTIADNSHQQKYDMNISGATEDAAYYVSFGYLDKEGWANLPRDKNYMYKRYNVLMKADFKINDWLSMDEQITWSAEHNDQPHFYNWDVNINTVARVSPHTKVTFPDLPYYLQPGDRDDYLPYIGKYWLNDLNALPYWEDGGRDTETEHRLLMKQGVTLTPLKGLRVRGDFSYSTYHRERQDVASKIEAVGNTADLANMYFENGFSGILYNPGDDSMLAGILKDLLQSFPANTLTWHTPCLSACQIPLSVRLPGITKPSSGG